MSEPDVTYDIRWVHWYWYGIPGVYEWKVVRRVPDGEVPVVQGFALTRWGVDRKSERAMKHHLSTVVGMDVSKARRIDNP